MLTSLRYPSFSTSPCLAHELPYSQFLRWAMSGYYILMTGIKINILPKHFHYGDNCSFSDSIKTKAFTPFFAGWGMSMWTLVPPLGMLLEVYTNTHLVPQTKMEPGCATNWPWNSLSLDSHLGAKKYLDCWSQLSQIFHNN